MIDTVTEERPASVLLVDDHRPNLLALEAILEPTGCRLVTASSGAEALDLAARHDFAVVLLDVCMPGLDGYEVAARLKRDALTRSVPLIFVTAVATDAQHIYRAYSVGAVDYLVKPLDTDVVRGKVATFVELWRQAAALREAERREHELRLAELRVASDRRYRKLVEGIDHVIAWSADPESLRLSFVSRQAARVLGYDPAHRFAPDFLRRHVHPDDWDGFVATVRTSQQGRDQAWNHRMVAADGRVLWFHTGMSCEASLDDPSAELHGVSADVTEIKQAEEEARRATRAREELLAIVSHDLKVPLQAIGLTVERLTRLDHVDSSEGVGRVKTGVAVIHRAATQMDRLIDDLLDMERIRRGALQLQLRTEAAASIARDAVEIMRSLAEEKELSLEVDVASVEPFTVACECSRIVQVLSNLIGNAIKFTPRGGEIRVAARADDERVEFSVSDTGPGVPAEQLASIFEYYTQGPRHARDGLGLGLAISRGIVEAHGGAIQVQSQVGRGSTFSFSLPRQRQGEPVPDPAGPA